MPGSAHHHHIARQIGKLRPEQQRLALAFTEKDSVTKYVYLGDEVDLLHAGDEPMTDEMRRRRHTKLLRDLQKAFLPRMM